MPLTLQDSQTVQLRRMLVLATHLNGAADTGKYSHITTDVVKREILAGRIFDFLARELDKDVASDLNKISEQERHMLSTAWRWAAEGFDTRQFHVERSGIALLVAYLLHIVSNGLTVVPT
jgi:hypothetical protein